MTLSRAAICAFAVIISLATCDGYNILALFPFRGTSHNLVLNSLPEALSRKGHNVTVAGFHEPTTPVGDNYKLLKYKPLPGMTLKGFLNLEDYSESDQMTTMYQILGMVKDYYELTKLNKDIYDSLLKEKFDLVILEYLESDLFIGFVEKLGAPYILFHTTVAFPWHRETMGDPNAPGLIPNAFSNRGVRMSFSERLWNTFDFFQCMAFHKMVLQTEAQKQAEEFWGPMPPLDSITRDSASLYLVNSHNSVFGATPTNPSTIEVGGLNVQPPKPLPQDLQNLLDNAKNGVVYFSMGSVLKGSSMSPKKRDGLLKVFSELKETVLWKYEDELPNSPPNVHISPWFPQRDIFAHPNVVLTIGHCGILGTHEAVTEGIPMICLPMYGDQFINGQILQENGMALSLSYAKLTEEDFRRAINKILTNSSFKENAKRVSAAFLDRPMSAMDTAIYWAEYVIRHKGAPHLKSPARSMTWVQYYNLDIIGVLGSIAALIILLLYKMTRSFITCLCNCGVVKKVKPLERNLKID